MRKLACLRGGATFGAAQEKVNWLDTFTKVAITEFVLKELLIQHTELLGCITTDIGQKK